MSHVNSLSLFVLICTVISASHAATTTFSKYDLYKNSGFGPCPAKFTNGTEEGWVSSLGTVAEVRRGQQFCDVVGEYIPIIIPAKAHSSAFTPGWFQFALQLIGWAVSFAGYWKSIPTTKKDAEKQEEALAEALEEMQTNPYVRPPPPQITELALPKTFWISLPYEIGRQLAWWIQAIRAFRNLPEASWISPVMYIAPALSAQFFAIVFLEAKHSTVFGRSVRTVSSIMCFPFLLSFIGMFITTIVLFVKRVQHGVGVVNYTVLDSVAANPSLLGADLPAECLRLAGSHGIVTDPQGSWWAWVQFGQFALCCWVFNKLAKFFRGAERKITATVLQLALALGASLIVPAIYQAISTPLNGKFYHSTLVNGGPGDGVCNLIIIFIDKKLGYVDIAYERGQRIVLGLLGVQ